MSEQKILELELCCRRYPSLRTRKSDGAKRVVCTVCDNASRYCLLASYLDVEIQWNEMRDKQLKVQNLYDGKQHWYKKT